MTIRRAALYIGGATLFAAWLSSAASLSLQRGPSRTPETIADAVSPAERLAADVQARARRLKQRLASAPIPQDPVRNPFMFRTAPPKYVETVRRREPVLPPVETAPPEPALTLIGIAEERRTQGVVRTAMIAAEADELIVAAIGDGVVQRYKVTAIGQDAVELADAVTGLVRRLPLRYQ
jgi:hypothetical protein